MSADALSSGERWLVATTEYAGLTRYTGGIGRHYASLLPALVRRGITVDLVVFSDTPPLAAADLAGVNLVGYRIARRVPRPILLVLRALQLRRVYARGAYDRIFLPEWAALGVALPRRAPLLTNLATSLRLSNRISGLRARDHPLRSRAGMLLQQRLEDRQIGRSAALISISRAMLDRTLATYGRLPPARIVRNCIEVHAVAAASRTAPLPVGWPDDDAPVLLFLGRLERRKGIEDAFRAFAIVHRRFPTVRLVLAGASGDSRFEPDRGALIALLPLGARDRVTWLGHVPGDELYRAIRASTIALCPSRWEGFGNAALEVKAIGVPLVCTSGSGFDDFCENGRDALLVPPADPRALATAIVRLLQDPALRRTLVAGGQSGIEAFAPDAVAADLVRAAHELLPLRPAPSPLPRA